MSARPGCSRNLSSQGSILGLPIFEDFELEVIEGGGRGEIEKPQVTDRHLVAWREIGGDVDDSGAAAILVILELGLDLPGRGPCGPGFSTWRMWPLWPDFSS